MLPFACINRLEPPLWAIHVGKADRPHCTTCLAVCIGHPSRLLWFGLSVFLDLGSDAVRPLSQRPQRYQKLALNGLHSFATAFVKSTAEFAADESRVFAAEQKSLARPVERGEYSSQGATSGDPSDL